MIELRITPTNLQHQLLQEQLDNMSLARKIIEIEANESPSLKEGKHLYQGLTDIQDALAALASFKEKWYECTCDKYDWL